MDIFLRNINIERLQFLLLKNRTKESIPITIQYADFNVLNYLYNKKFSANELKQIYLYPDSSALFFYIKFFIDSGFKKIISTDLQNNFLFELDKIKSSVYFFGDSDLVLENVVENIKNKYSNIKIIGTVSGYNFDTEKIISEINKKEVNVLFVGLGLGRQEKWILENHKKLNVKIILSVGGWFQYLAGNKKRAPLLLRKIHLEWLHKIIVEFPRVWKRYLIGFPIFLYRVFSKKIQIVIKNNYENT